jgi:DNA-binding MarR family transcriptional regulator
MSATPSTAARGPLSYAIYRLARAHRAYARRLLEELGLYAGQELLLMHLWDRGEADQSELAAALEIEKPTVTKMLQRLEQEGLVTRERLGSNRRRVIVRCTPAGRDLQPDVARMWAELEAATTSELAGSDRDELVQTIHSLTAGLTKEEEP